MSGFSGKYELFPDGWIGGWMGRPRWEFTNDAKDPLTYGEMLLVRPDNHFFTDLGSVPRTLQKWVPIWFDRARWPKSYIFHDSGYKHGGHWIAANGSDWHFVEMTRKDVDRYLYEMLLAEGAGKTNAKLVYWGVRIGGVKAWKKKVAPKDTPSEKQGEKTKK